jgi:hypothetical protein
MDLAGQVATKALIVYPVLDAFYAFMLAESGLANRFSVAPGYNGAKKAEAKD